MSSAAGNIRRRGDNQSKDFSSKLARVTKFARQSLGRLVEIVGLLVNLVALWFHVGMHPAHKCQPISSSYLLLHLSVGLVCTCERLLW